MAPGVRDLCYADDRSRLQQHDDIFIMDGEAQRHVRLTPHNALALVRFDVENSRRLTKSIKTNNGDFFLISYRQYQKHLDRPMYFPVRWAIDQITDTVGRVIQFLRRIPGTVRAPLIPSAADYITRRPST